jgi:6-phosphogluconolactonase (cycloisomerase 2 family)
MAAFAIDGPSGKLAEAAHVLSPEKKVVAHSRLDHLNNRQLEPHAHAIVLDPIHGKVAVVPDLGLDLLRIFLYDDTTGQLTPACDIAPGPTGRAKGMRMLLVGVGTPGLSAALILGRGLEGRAHGPRYIEFHPGLPVAYVVNELSSTVSVFVYHPDNVLKLVADPSCGAAVLTFYQSIGTIPTGTCSPHLLLPLTLPCVMQGNTWGGWVGTRPHGPVTWAVVTLAFPGQLNTCGRITCDPTGQTVLVSNRGHNSIATFKVLLLAPRSVLCGGKGGRGHPQIGAAPRPRAHLCRTCSAAVGGQVNSDDGQLTQLGFYHTRGRTPRHFQFDASGRWLVVANQDTDTLSVFAFDPDNGTLTFTGNSYDVPSPNFVCVRTPHPVA